MKSVDRYMLHLLYELQVSLSGYYEDMAYNKVILTRLPEQFQSEFFVSSSWDKEAKSNPAHLVAPNWLYKPFWVQMPSNVPQDLNSPFAFLGELLQS